MNPQFKVVITQANLYVWKVKVAPAISLRHAAALKQATAKYPISQIECKVLSIPGGFPTFTPSSETQGLLVGMMQYFRASEIFDAKVYFKG